LRNGLHPNPAKQADVWLAAVQQSVTQLQVLLNAQHTPSYQPNYTQKGSGDITEEMQHQPARQPHQPTRIITTINSIASKCC